MVQSMRFRVSGVGFEVWSLAFRVEGSEFSVWSLGFRVEGLNFRVQSIKKRFSDVRTHGVNCLQSPPLFYIYLNIFCTSVVGEGLNVRMMDSGTFLEGVRRESKILTGHLPSVIYRQVYLYTKIMQGGVSDQESCLSKIQPSPIA